MRVAIVGGTGFVGAHTARAFLDDGHEVVLVARGVRRRATRQGVTRVRADVTGPVATLSEAFRTCDAVVNLAAIARETGDQKFDAINNVGAANVAAAVKAAGVPHLVHLSALGVGPEPHLEFLKSKWDGEQAVRRSGAPVTVVRSSIVFGPGDLFATRLARIIRMSRVVAPIVGLGTTPLQPIAVADLAKILVITAGRTPQRGTIEVGGPEHFTYKEFVGEIKRAIGVRRFDLHVPVNAVMPAAAVLTFLLPNSPVTPDELRTLTRPLVTRPDSVMKHYGFAPARFADASAYLHDS